MQTVAAGTVIRNVCKHNAGHCVRPASRPVGDTCESISLGRENGEPPLSGAGAAPGSRFMTLPPRLLRFSNESVASSDQGSKGIGLCKVERHDSLQTCSIDVIKLERVNAGVYKAVGACRCSGGRPRRA